MEKIQLNLTSEQKEITIRQGDALPAKADKSIIINGTLGAPFQFLKGVRDTEGLKEDTMHLQIFNASGVLVLYSRDTDPYTTHIITGSLTKDKVLEMFGINTERRWTIRDFLKFIKTMRFYFDDRAAHTALVDSIQKWSVKVERAIVEHNDLKGNSNYQLETKVKSVEGMIYQFVLNIPIFQGYSKMKFTVEIGLDPKNTAVDLFLISDELIELEIQTREKLLADELKNFDEFKFSKVVVN